MSDIAIIGVAGRFPEAKNIEELYRNLKAGKDSAKPPSKERLKATSAPVNKKYKVFSWLDDIEMFDHKFFNISLAEAQNMDPHQRLILEVAYETFESSGYSIDYFSGSSTAVYSGDVNLKYHQLAEKFDPTLLTGNINAATAGRIARFFNLRGSTMMIDTNCSSTLVATHLACNELRSGDAEHALICGVRLIISPEEDAESDNMGIMTQDGKTKSFSAAADGTGAGEAVAAILLKPLEKAVADNDHIYAVIKGSAVNQEAQLSGSLTAPSSAAQAEVIQKAWQKAGIDPLSISYIEPHGSGTKLGDPIEIQGIDQAYKGLANDKNFVAVSALKSNIGHTDTVAGLSGLIKVILMLQHKKLFPSLHFDEPNPFIDFDNSVTYINTEYKKWETVNGNPRRAGVSSFGLSGTNCHLILEESPAQAEQKSQQDQHLINISSRTAKGLAANIRELKAFLEAEKEVELADISHTLNRGRKHFSCRFSILVDSISTLKAKLGEALENFEYEKKASRELKKLFFIFSDDTVTDKSLIQSYCDQYASFKEHFGKCIKAAPEKAGSTIRTFAFQYAFYKLLEELDISTDSVLGLGLGRVVIDVISGNLSLEEGIKSAVQYKKEPVDELEKRLKALVERETAREKVAFVEIGTGGTLIEGLKGLNIRDRESRYAVFDLDPNSENTLPELLKALYLANYTINWQKAHPANAGKKIKLPAYKFEPVRCWLKEPSTEEEEVLDETASAISSQEARRIVPAEDLSGFDPDAVEIDASWTLTQQKIARFWIEVLKLDEVDLDDDFFRLGGHSLIATQLISRIEDEYGIRVAFKDVSVFSTVRSLAEGVDQLIEAHGGKPLDNIALRPVEEREFYPLSAAQKRIWIMDQLEEAATTYNLPGVMILEGKLDKERFDAAFRALVERHESLRTSFRVEKGEPVQVIHPKVEFSVIHTKASEDELKDCSERFIRPFDLSEAPLLRVELVETAPQKHLLLLDIHHIVSDGVSAGIILSDFVQLYSDKDLPELNIQYKDFAVWQEVFFKSEQLKAQESYWLDKFSGELPVLNLPADFPRPAVQRFEGDRINLELTVEDTTAIKELCRETGTSIYMALLAIYNVLLHKYTAQEDIIIGSVIAGRTRSQLEGIVGMFVNTLAMRNHPSGEKTFEAFLQEVKETALEAYSNQDYPFEVMVDKLNLQRDLSRNPLFDTLITYQNFYKQDEASLNIEDLSIRPYPFENKTSKFDITLEITEGKDTLSFQVEYSTCLFRKKTIERLFNHFIQIARTVSDHKEIKLAEIIMLSSGEREKVLKEFNNTTADFDLKTPVTTLFEQAAKAFPDKLAIVAGQNCLTFQELDERSNQLAALLLQMKIQKGDVVGVLMQASVEMYIGMWGIIKAGAVYMPIDPAYPQGRIDYMLETSGAKALLINNGQQISNTAMPIVDLASEEYIHLSSSKPEVTILAGDLAYVMFTSGSTGKPKGVEVTHRSLLNLCHWYNLDFEITPEDKVTKYAGVGFDASIIEIFPSTLKGATSFVIPEEYRLDMRKLNQFFEENQISVAFLPTPVAEQFMQLENKSLRVLHIGGDQLGKYYKQQYKVVNDYGPSENTVVSTYFLVEEGYQKIPVGRPVPNVSIYILDKKNNPQPIGIPGEICVAGENLARGYRNRPDLTEEKFVPNPFRKAEKMYRTGDLGRWLPDGNVEFLGRMDSQVKIRGHRVELGEIENILLNFPSIAQAVVIDRKGQDGQIYLTGYYLADTEVDQEALQKHLQQFLPKYMIPDHLAEIEEIPLTANGKVDKSALSAPDMVKGQAKYIEPGTKAERQLAVLWQEVLNVEKAGAEDNFFLSGGHSLKAVQLIGRVYETFQAEISLRDIFKYPVLKHLAAHIMTREKVVFQNIEPAPALPHYPLSAAQERLYILNRLREEDTSYNMPGVLLIEGKLDISRFDKILRELIQRHESLRTAFKMVNEEPVQVVLSKVDFAVDYLELPEEKVEKEIRKFVQPFRLSVPPLIRVKLIKTGDEKHYFLFDMHHIINDELSMNLLVTEFAALYGGELLPPLRIQYKDYAVWQNNLQDSESLAIQWEYWTEQFAGDIPVLELPTDYARPPVKSFRGNRLAFEIESGSTEWIKALAWETGTTSFMVLLAAYHLLLHKYSQQEDIVIGTPVAGRKHPDLEQIIGVFINTLALRNKPSPDKSVLAFLNEIKESVLSAQENQEVQFEELVTHLSLPRDMSRHPLFDVLFVYQTAATEVPALEAGGLTFQPKAFDISTSKFDITLTIAEGQNSFKAFFDYSTDLFDELTIERLATHFNRVLDELLVKTGKKIADIELHTPEEKHLLLKDFNNTVAAYPRDKPFHAVFEAVVNERRAETAVVYPGEQSLSYEALNKKANQLAARMVKAGAGKNIPVGIVMDRSVEMVIAITGTLKAGSAFVPIDASYPLERMRMILEDSGAEIVVTRQYLKNNLPFKGEVICVDDKKLSTEPDTNPGIAVSAEDLAYIIYTSGSTGKPKGTLLRHYNLMNYIYWFIGYSSIAPEDKTILLHSFGFDGSFTNLFGALTAGHELHIVPQDYLIDPSQLLHYIQNKQITYMKFTPSLFTVMVNSETFEQQNLCTSLKMIMIGGEQINTADVEKFHLKYPDTKFINHYGPTETTVGSVAATIDFNHWEEYKEKPFIGKPIANTRCYIVDPDLNLSALGAVGELCIAGDGVAKEYLNRPGLSKERFVTDPFAEKGIMYRTGDLARWLPEGNLLFLGRKDNQIKIRGYRIEPAEITNILLRIKQITKAAVVDWKDKTGNISLCAYYVSSADIHSAEIRKKLSKLLPDYMLPSSFFQVNHIPVTAHGKIDKARLPHPAVTAEAGKEYVAPRNETEQQMLEIWKELLGKEKISITDNFFELGGHSLKAATLAGRVHRAFEIKLPLKSIFNQPTIEGLAGLVKNHTSSAYSAIEPARKAESYPLASVQKRLVILQEFKGAETTYNLPMVLEVEGEVDKGRFEAAFRQLIQRHESLRTSFHAAEEGFMQKVQDGIDFEVEYLQCSEEEAREMANNFSQPFNLEQPPLFRVKLVTFEKERHLLMIDMHHIISDGTSTAIMIEDFFAFYDGKAPDPLHLHYKDYAVWQNQEEQQKELEEQSQYWKQKLSGKIPVLNFPTDKPRPHVQDFSGAHVYRTVDHELTGKIKDLALKNDTTLYVLLLATYNVLLHKYTRQEDFIVGSPVAGRTHPDLERVVGSFANTIVLRNQLNSEMTFKSFLAKAKETTLEAVERQSFPFEELINMLNIERDVSRNPLFDTLFAYQNFEGSDQEVISGKLSFTPYRFENNISKFDFSLIIYGTDELKLGLEYATSLFHRESMEAFAEHYINLLKVVINEPEARIADLDILSEEEKHRLLVEFNDTATDYPHDKTIVDLVEEAVERHPDKIALIFGEKKLTYGELNKKANQLARKLRESGVKPDDKVGLIIDRNMDIHTGILGILKSGAAYLPIDPKNPWERSLFMLQDSGTEIIVTQKHLLDRIRFEGTVINISDPALFTGDGTNLPSVNKATDLAYMIYTSGSTGKPKGVMLEHQNVVSYAVNFGPEYNIAPDDIMLSLTRITFDMSNTEHTASMINGLTMVITTTEQSNDPVQLSEIISKTGANVMQFTPSRLNLMLNTVGDSFLENVKILLVGAEALPVSLNKRLLEYKHIQTHNVYGPTEATTWSTGARIEEQRVTIGKPHRNEHVYILSEQLRLLPIGVPGEICIAGPGVGRGYTDKELSRQKFVESPFSPGERMYRTGDLGRWWPDGHLEFIGRRDFQVKVRGYRVELGEIENNLLQYPGIREVAVIVKENQGENELVAYLVSEKDIQISEMNEFLTKSLPEYMLPAHYMKLDEMPLNENDKLDRKQLPDPEGKMQASKKYEPPENQLQKELCTIWQDVLNIDRIGIKDNFFIMGGNSLKAVSIISRIKEQLDIKVSFTLIFSHPTIEQMSMQIASRSIAGDEDELTLLNKKQDKHIFAFPPAIGYAIAYSDLAEHIKGHSFYGFNFVESDDRLEKYVSKILEIQPEGEYTLFGYSAGGNLAFEVAAELSKRGKKADIVMVDAYKKSKAETVTESEKEEYARLYISDDPDHISSKYLKDEDMKKAAVHKIGSYYSYIKETVNKGKISGTIYFLRSETKNKDNKGRESWQKAAADFIELQGVGEHAEMFNATCFEQNISLLLKMLNEKNITAEINKEGEYIQQ